MIELFLFVGLPYIAIVVAILGCWIRFRYARQTVSSLSSQFLEDKQLKWGSAPWHIGIILILLGHVVAGFFPKVWSSILMAPYAVWLIEMLGLALSILAIVGLTVLIVRRLTSSRVQAVTSTMDLIVLALLMAQIVVGFLSAIFFSNGAAWSTGTVTPYFWSLIKLQPDMSYVTGFPALFKIHIVGAWLLVLLLPFTRLIHVLTVPLEYLWRLPQIVRWNTSRRLAGNQSHELRVSARRDFIKGAAGLTFAGGLLAMGVGEKLLNFFKGPSSDDEEGSEILVKKLRRLQKTVEERELELERKRNAMILVSNYSDLDEKKGKYFIDYAMTPGLIFKGSDGYPILISAKCTHLGCTVGSEIDDQGRILCPCHVSYFNVKTGMPNEGAPAKAPLPHLGWAIVDTSGKILAQQGVKGEVQVTGDPAALTTGRVYITRPPEVHV